MKQSIARALRRLADRFDPPARRVINIQNINGQPLTAEAQRRLNDAYRSQRRAVDEFHWFGR